MGLTNRLKQKARLGAVFGGFIGEGNIDLKKMRKIMTITITVFIRFTIRFTI
jgi:hypothetical protein